MKGMAAISYNAFLHPMPCAQLLTREIRLPYGTSTDAQVYSD